LYVPSIRSRMALSQTSNRTTMSKRPISEFAFCCVSLVYVLKLEDDCWYVGLTSNLNARIAEHFGLSGRFGASNWTRAHRPVSIQEVVVGDYAIENEMTEKYIAMYGSSKVQGGKYLGRKNRNTRTTKTCSICRSKIHTVKTERWCMKRFIEAFEIELKPCKIYTLNE